LYQILLLGSAKIKQQNLINVSMMIAGAINLGLSILMVKLGHGIVGVALATVVSNFILVFLYFAFAHRYYLNTIEIWFYLKIIIPLISLIAILISDINIFHFESSYSMKSISVTFVACLLFILFYRWEFVFAFVSARKYLRRSWSE